jgi:CBS domain-containing protein
MIYANYDLLQKIGSIAEKDYVTLSPDTLVGDAAKIMRDKGILSVLVSGKDSNEPIGIVIDAYRHKTYNIYSTPSVV